jgi:CRP/FNR family cyclic AMP-dependent transcriptional regulator
MGLLIDVLRSVDFLASASSAEVERFMVRGRCAEHPRHHVFWRAGDSPDRLVVVVSGEAKSVTRSPDGREIIHSFMGPGACVGLAGVLDGLPRPHDAEVARSGEFFSILRDDLWPILDANPRLRRAAIAMLGTMYRRAVRNYDDVVFRLAAQRVAKFFLARACVRQTDGARVLVVATVEELAARMGMAPEVAYRLLTRLRDSGLIRRAKRTVFVRDWDGLRAFAGPEIGDGGVDDAALARERTARFFLPMVHERRAGSLSEEAAKCHGVLGDLTLCRERGCPAALAYDVAP